MRVVDLMDTEPPVTFVPGQRSELRHLFRMTGMRGVPVLKAGTRKLAGLVLRTDLTRNPEEDQTALLMDPNPYTLYPQASIREAATGLVDCKVPIVPVVNGSNDLVGVLTARPLLESLRNHRGRVQTYSRRRVAPVHQGTPLRVALKVLHLTRAPALPVLDDEASLVGLVTDGDLVRRVEAALSDPREPSRPFRIPNDAVASLMVRHPLTVQPLTSVGEAAALMIEHGIAQVPVVDDGGALIDLITDVDLVAALC